MSALPSDHRLAFAIGCPECQRPAKHVIVEIDGASEVVRLRCVFEDCAHEFTRTAKQLKED